MSKDWIIEVLGDLRGFATMNEMPTLAAQLEESIVVAIAEVSQAERGTSRTGKHDAEAARRVGEPR
jgi:hypothetical protein